MTNLRQHRGWSWRIRVGLATAALASVGLLGRVVVMTPSAEAHADATFTLLYSFQGGADGASPRARLVQDAAGNLYGTTTWGGGSNLGTVFNLDTAGAETVLYSFTGNPDGANPYAGLVRDTAGNLYGTTFRGGGSDLGTVFKLDTTGKETVLHNFTGADGQHPAAILVGDAAGNFYGTTTSGGNSNNCAGGCGTVFKLDTTGAETVLHYFTAGTDGYYPDAGLVRDTAGNLYGTTAFGGTSDLGTVFKVDGTGKETVGHYFTGGTDGYYPDAGLVRDAAGNLYGTTGEGGNSYSGTVFKLDATGAETVLHTFRGFPDGALPHAGLVRDAAGNLYGTTYLGGRIGNGTVFKVDATTGAETVLYSFSELPGGTKPHADLLRDAAGNLYGTTTDGGAFGKGTVFKLSR